MAAGFASSLAAGVAAWWYTAPGLFLTPDSASYLGVADNLANGRGLTSPFPPETATIPISEQLSSLGHVPLTEWPPLYPVVLWMAGITGASPLAVGRWVNVMSVAALAAVLGWALVRLADVSPVLVALVPLSIVFAPVLSTDVPLLAVDAVGQAGFLLSESLFLPCYVFAVVVGAAAATSSRRSTLAVGVGAVVVATLVRFAGLTTGVGAAVASVRSDGRTRLGGRRALLLGAAGPIALVAWSVARTVVWGGEGDSIVWHPPGWETARNYVDVVSGWFAIPPGWHLSIRAVLSMFVLVGLAASVVSPPVRRRLTGDALEPGTRGGNLAMAMVASIIGYVALLVVTQWLVDANVATTQRLLAPVQVLVWPLVFASAVAGGRHLGAGAAGDRRWQVRVGSVMAAGLAIAMLTTSLWGLSDRRSLFSYAVEMAATGVEESPLRQLPKDVLVVTNATGAAYIETGRAPLLLPSPIVAVTGEPNPAFGSELEELAMALAEREGIVLVKPGFGGIDQDLLDGLEGRAGLVLGRACANGDLLFAAAPVPAFMSRIRC